jgi:hypothetical protein
MGAMNLAGGDFIVALSGSSNLECLPDSDSTSAVDDVGILVCGIMDCLKAAKCKICTLTHDSK